jgi:hypothetical protein
MKELSRAEALKEFGNSDHQYGFLNILEDTIWALKRLIPMYAAVLFIVFIWACFDSQIKTALLSLWAAINHDVKDTLEIMKINFFRMF